MNNDHERLVDAEVRLRQLDQELAEVQRDGQTDRANLAHLAAVIARLRGRVDEAVEVIVGLPALVAGLAQRVVALESRVDALEGRKPNG